MRLTDLDAEFIGERTETSYRRLDSIEGAQGLSFQCPGCSVGKETGEEDGRRFVRGAHYVLCWFRNPRGADPVPADALPGPGRWWIEGTGLDDLTFDYGQPVQAKSIQLGCWHGFITNGEVTTC